MPRVYPTRQRKPAKSVVCLPIDSSTSDPRACASPNRCSIVLRRLRLIQKMDAFHPRSVSFISRLSRLRDAPRFLPSCTLLSTCINGSIGMGEMGSNFCRGYFGNFGGKNLMFRQFARMGGRGGEGWRETPFKIDFPLIDSLASRGTIPLCPIENRKLAY